MRTFGSKSDSDTWWVKMFSGANSWRHFDELWMNVCCWTQSLRKKLQSQNQRKLLSWIWAPSSTGQMWMIMYHHLQKWMSLNLLRLLFWRQVSGASHTHTHLTALFPGLPRWAGTRKVEPICSLLKQETVSGSGISWAICKSAPHSRLITTPATHHSNFSGQMPFLPPNQHRQRTGTSQDKEYFVFFLWVSCHCCR